MKARVTWNGSSQEVHPELGLLVPGQTIERELSPELRDALLQDASGLFHVEPSVRPHPGASTRRTPTPAAAEEDVTHG